MQLQVLIMPVKHNYSILIKGSPIHFAVLVMINIRYVYLNLNRCMVENTSFVMHGWDFRHGQDYI